MRIARDHNSIWHRPRGQPLFSVRERTTATRAPLCPSVGSYRFATRLLVSPLPRMLRLHRAFLLRENSHGNTRTNSTIRPSDCIPGLLLKFHLN